MAKSKRNQTLVLTDEERIKYSKLLKTEFSSFNEIINNDIFNAIDDIPDNSIDLLLTDPPYNIPKIYSDTKFNAKSTGDYLRWFEKWITLIIPKLKKNASLYICNDWRGSSIQLVLEKYFYVKNRITFERDKGRGSKTNWKNSSEDIWFCTNSNNDYYFNADIVKIKKKIIAPYVDKDGKPKDWEESEDGRFRLTSPSNLWTDITIPFWSMPENTDHPTQKPEKLIAKLILASSKEGDVVFDPFGGSGTTAVVSKKLNRNFLLIEREEEYCFYGIKRLEGCKKEDRIQGYENGFFLSRNFHNSKN